MRSMQATDSDVLIVGAGAAGAAAAWVFVSKWFEGDLSGTGAVDREV